MRPARGGLTPGRFLFVLPLLFLMEQSLVVMELTPLEKAFTRLLDRNDKVCGKKQIAVVNNRTVRALIAAITSEEVAIAGGSGEQGGFRIEVLVRGFASKPVKGNPVKAHGRQLKVSGPVIERNQTTYEITAGDLSVST